MNEVESVPLNHAKRAQAPLPPEIKGNFLLGVMPDFNRDILGLISKEFH